jgi:hypothetical protein
VELSDMDVKEIDSILASVEIVGDRYGHGAHLLYGDTKELKE